MNIENYIVTQKEPRKLSTNQKLVYIGIHMIIMFIILLPILIIEEFIKNDIIYTMLYIIYLTLCWWSSFFIQRNITNNLFNLIYPKLK